MLADVARVGPFFTVATEPGHRPGFRPLAELWSTPAPLRERIGHVAGSLRSGRRVAASIVFQGIVASLVSAPLAAAATHGVVPRFDPDRLYVCPEPNRPWSLWCPAPEGRRVDPGAAAAAALDSVVLGGLVAPLVAVVRAQVAVSERVLWGNAASAVAGAVRVLVRARPAVAVPVAETARHLLTQGRLAGTGRLLPAADPAVPWSFRRASCCLYYRVPGGGWCEDCVLHDRQGR